MSLGMGLRQEDVVKLQLRKHLQVNMRSGAGLDHQTTKICGIRSEIMQRLGGELEFEHDLEEADEQHHLVSISGRATCHDKGATTGLSTPLASLTHLLACQAHSAYILC